MFNSSIPNHVRLKLSKKKTKTQAGTEKNSKSYYINEEPYSAIVDYSSEARNGWNVLSKIILNKFDPRHEILAHHLRK
jgi:hypothetical protein